MHRNEYREEPRGLADLLLPFAMIDDGILLHAGWLAYSRLDVPRPGHDVGIGRRNGRAQRQAEFGDAAGQRLDGPMRCNTVPARRVIRNRAPFPTQSQADRRRAPPAVSCRGCSLRV